MNVEVLQKVVVEITKEKVNTQEPPSKTPIATSEQAKEKEDVIALVGSSVIVTTNVKEKDKENIV